MNIDRLGSSMENYQQLNQQQLLKTDDDFVQQPRQIPTKKDNRKDSYGEAILKHSKKHRIRFKNKDDLEHVIVVENWKQYNEDVSVEYGCGFCKLI